MDEKEINYRIIHEKLKLHVNYIIGISIAITALVIIASSYGNVAFVGQVSFAGTVSSIILSVIAIIITIIGETKSDNTKDKLVNVSSELENIANNIIGATSKLEASVNSNQELSNGIYTMQNKLEDIGQKINAKDIQTNDEMVVDEESDMFNCYIKVFRNASVYLREELYKELSLTLFYSAKKIENGSLEIRYDEFLGDMQKLQINFNNSSDGWIQAFIFARGLWGSGKFRNCVKELTIVRYADEIQK